MKETTAASILAEIGPDISPFPSAKHLCSRAGICPGNNRSAGKSKHGRIKEREPIPVSGAGAGGMAAAHKRIDVPAPLSSVAREIGRGEGEPRHRAQLAQAGLRPIEGAQSVSRARSRRDA